MIKTVKRGIVEIEKCGWAWLIQLTTVCRRRREKRESNVETERGGWKSTMEHHRALILFCNLIRWKQIYHVSHIDETNWETGQVTIETFHRGWSNTPTRNVPPQVTTHYQQNWCNIHATVQNKISCKPIMTWRTWNYNFTLI